MCPVPVFRAASAFKNKKSFGNDLLSQGVAPQVPSALANLTTGFGMLPGVVLAAQITKGQLL